MLENLYIALAKHHRDTRETRGLVGLKAGITESRLSRIVHGWIEATPDERAALSQALGVEEGYLFTQGEQPAASTATAAK
jgi:hypothetical protein